MILMWMNDLLTMDWKISIIAIYAENLKWSHYSIMKNLYLKKMKYYKERFGVRYLILLAMRKLSICLPYVIYKMDEMDYKYYSALDLNDIKREIELLYHIHTGKKMNIDAPITLNEKIQWLKLYDNLPVKGVLADKYLAHEEIGKRVGKKYLVNILGVFDTFDEIDFAQLPNKFVIKTNHGSGFNVIVRNKDKVNRNKLRNIFKWYMKVNFAYYGGFEFQYLNMDHKIIIEEFLGDDIFEYKFMCFNGEPEFFWVRSNCNDGIKRNYYSIDKNKLDFKFGIAKENMELELVDDSVFEELVSTVKKLAEGFKFVRIDTYVLKDQRFYIGELTFSTGSGYDKWVPEEKAIYYGKLINTVGE